MKERVVSLLETDFSPTSSVEEAEKALPGSLKFQPTPSGMEQGAVYKEKSSFSERW